MILARESFCVFTIIKSLDLLIYLLNCSGLFLFSPFLLEKFFLVLFCLYDFLSIKVLSSINFSEDIILFFLNCCHFLPEGNNFIISIVALLEVMLESCPIKWFFIKSPLLIDLKVNSFGVEFVVFNFLQVKRLIFWGNMNNTKLRIISDLGLSPISESHKVINERVLFNGLKTGVL